VHSPATPRTPVLAPPPPSRYDELPCGRLSTSAADTLYQWADLLLLAPLSPDALAEISHGIVSDFLTQIAASWGYRLLEPADETGIDRSRMDQLRNDQPEIDRPGTDQSGMAERSQLVLRHTEQGEAQVAPQIAAQPGIEAEPQIAAEAAAPAPPRRTPATESAETRIVIADPRIAARGTRIAGGGPRLDERVLRGSTILIDRARIAAGGGSGGPMASSGGGCDSATLGAAGGRGEGATLSAAPSAAPCGVWVPVKPIVAALAVPDRGWSHPATVANAEVLKRRGVVMCSRIRVGVLEEGEGGGGWGGSSRLSGGVLAGTSGGASDGAFGGACGGAVAGASAGFAGDSTGAPTGFSGGASAGITAAPTQARGQARGEPEHANRKRARDGGGGDHPSSRSPLAATDALAATVPLAAEVTGVNDGAEDALVRAAAAVASVAWGELHKSVEAHGAACSR
jgi:hypothetical protein